MIPTAPIFSQVPPQVLYILIFEPELPVGHDGGVRRRQPAHTVPHDNTAVELRYGERLPDTSDGSRPDPYRPPGYDPGVRSYGSPYGTHEGRGWNERRPSRDDDDYVDYDDNDSVWAYVRVGDKFSYWMPRPVTRRTPTLMPTPSHSRDVDPDERHYRVSSAARNGGEYADADGETIAIQRGPTQHHHHAYTLLHHPFPDVNEDNNDGPDPHHRPLDSRLRSSRHRDAERVEILRTPWPRDAYNSWRHGYREGGSETDHPHTRRSDSIRTHSGDVNEGPVAILRVPVHSHRYRPNSQNYRDDRYDDDRSSFARNHSGTADEPRVQILRGPRTTHWHGGNDGDHNNRTHSGCVGEEPVAILRRPEPKWQSHGWRLLKPTPLRPILTPGFSPPHQ